MIGARPRPRPRAVALAAGAVALAAVGAGAVGLVAGCTPDRATALADGLARKDCSAVPDTALRDSCWTTLLRCDRVEGARDRADCAFRAAEAHGDPKGCADAGEWADDCRLHVWTGGLRKWAPRDVPLVDAEGTVAGKVTEYGFAADDPRPWSAWYRHALGRMRPLDRAQCRTLPDASHVEACLQTGLALYGDLLNVARDQKLYPCDGGPLPSLLQTTPDPELDALRASRTDLCPG